MKSRRWSICPVARDLNLGPASHPVQTGHLYVAVQGAILSLMLSDHGKVQVKKDVVIIHDRHILHIYMIAAGI